MMHEQSTRKPCIHTRRRERTSERLPEVTWTVVGLEQSPAASHRNRTSKRFIEISDHESFR